MPHSKTSTGILGLNIIDAGAMDTGDEPYKPLLEKYNCQVAGFEPVEHERQKLIEKYPGFLYLPYFLGDGSEHIFYLTNHSMTASLFKPNYAFTDLFENLSELMQVVEMHKVQTVKLDEISELSDFDTDYIKADIQGAEQMLFQNGSKHLERAVIIHTEIAFCPLYEGQALFSNIDDVLRSADFEFHTFLNMEGRPYKNPECKTTANQILWADAVYVKSPSVYSGISSEKLTKLGDILESVYKSEDLAAFIRKFT